MASCARSFNSCVPRLAASQDFKHRQVEFISSPRNLYSAWAARLSFTVRPSHAYGRKERVGLSRHAIECRAAGAGAVGGEPADELSPYQVLGVSPLDKFDNIKAVYTRRCKDAARQGDEAAMARFERAYDRIMMTQLSNRKQSLTYGSFEVSKEIKYADKQALFPWGPRAAHSNKWDILINLAISVLFSIWMVSAGSAEWKPLQFLIFGYMFRIFNKLKDFEPAPSSFSSEDEDQSRRSRNGKRLLRTLGLVFSCVAFASLAFTGTLNMFELLGQNIPRSFINSQELFVTLVSSALLFFIGSYYR